MSHPDPRMRRLEIALTKIAELVVLRRTSFEATPELDLYGIGIGFREMAPLITQALAQQVERLSDGQQTVRKVAVDYLVNTPGIPFGLQNVYCVMCPADTPQGEVMPTAGMFAFVVGPANPGYMALPVG